MIKRLIILTLLIASGGIPVASAAEWDSATFTLSLENPVVSKGDYTLNVVEFDGYGMVSINVSNNGVFIGSTVLVNNDSNWCYMDNDRIRLKGVNVTDQRVLPLFGSIYSPQAEIIFATEKIPKDSVSLALSISTDKEEYLLDQAIITTVKIRNTGEVKIDGIRLGIDSDNLLIQGDLPSGFSLGDGTYRSEEIKFRFPAALLKGFYNISVDVSWNDARGTRYFLEDSTTVQVQMPLEIRKSTTSETIPGKPVYTSLSVENVQTRPVTVRLTDVLPMCFTLIDGTVTDNKSDLNWKFVLAPHERKVFSYQMNPEQVGAHRVPQVHATWNLWGEDCTNSSESDNIIAVYRGVSYRERDFPDLPPAPDAVVEVLSGEDFSNYVDANGFALVDIKVKNDTLNAFVFIPRGTKILDANNTRLTEITIKQFENQLIHSNLRLVGEIFCQLEPNGSTFDPHIYVDLPYNTSMVKGGTPRIYRYNNNTTWSPLNSLVSEGRISARLNNFSVYAVFVESPVKVMLGATIRPAISIEVTPGSFDFGKLAPGSTSNRKNMTIDNCGTSSILVTANVTEEGNLYKQGLDIDGNSLESFNVTVAKNMLKTPYVALNVPETYEGVGSKTGTLIFWAEGVN